MTPPIRFVCSGCGYEVPARDPHPFRCPRAEPGDDVDHLLQRIVVPDRLPSTGVLQDEFLDPESNPFLKYRKLLWSFQAALAGGLGGEDFAAVVSGLNDAVAGIDGHGFRATPCEPFAALARELGVAGLWVKDETRNVSGSHKARHLMGVMIWLDLARRLEMAAEPAPLAIASCGNAALAAAVIASAAGRRLRVFIPADARPAVVTSLERLGADIEICARPSGFTGDPSFHTFREAVAGGALPFTCQGTENALISEGGETLAFEMISTMIEHERDLDRLVVQVGGGALATALIRGFEEARALGLIDRVPRFHTVQSQGASPLARAYDRVVEWIVGKCDQRHDSPKGRAARAAWILDAVAEETVAAALLYAATHRSAFMWPWEEEPKSVAYAILDDETYDWLAVVRGMLATGGYPLVVSEEALRRANGLGREATGIPVDATGTAGLAGCLELQRAAALSADEEIGVVFTGVERR